MLTELVAKAVHQWAESIQKPLSECPLPEELITLCQHSPTKAVLGIHAITFIVKMDKLIENEEKATKKRRLNV